MKIAVIGAGGAGLTCALKLKQKGVDVEVFEASPYVGGMARSMMLWKQRVDLGPHRFFSMDRRVNDFWREQTGEEREAIHRLTRIFYSKKFFYYPIRVFDALWKLGLFEAFLCFCSYLVAQLKSRKDEKTFEAWVSHRFGTRLFRIFFKSYSERLWGIPCAQLDADFAAQRIKGLNFFEVLKSALCPSAGKRHKTLADQFDYPENACGQTYERMAEKIREGAGNSDTIKLNTVVHRVCVADGKVTGIELEDGKFLPFDCVVSTAPITSIVLGIPDLPEDVRKAALGLRYRNTTLVYLQVAQLDVFQDNWIYVHEPYLKTGRITNFRNWAEKMRNGQRETILVLEYWSYGEDPIWKMSDEALIALGKRELAETGLVHPEKILDGKVIRLHRSYPVYARGYKEKLQYIQRFVDQIQGLVCIGRNGSFKYNNQDHSILMGLLAAENIVDHTKHPLWKINTDYDYQEGGRVEETQSPERKI